MAQFITITGCGYFRDSNGNITDKFVLSPGPHDIRDGYTAVDVADINALNNIVISDTRTVNAKWEEIRRIRDAKLRYTDWIVLVDSPKSVNLMDQWKTYRQALRDVPLQADPDNIVWPTPPEVL